MLAAHMSRELAVANGTAIYFFCERYEKRNTPTAIVNALIYQMIELLPQSFEMIRDDFQKRQMSMFDEGQFRMLWPKLEVMVAQQTTRVFCIIDGLDECDVDSLEPLLQALDNSFNKSSTHNNFHMVLTSRHHPFFIAERLDAIGVTTIDLDTHTEVQNDLARYIAAKIDHLAGHKRFSAESKNTIASALELRCEGTFLWSSLMMKQLSKKKPHEMLRAIQSFPKGLGCLYDRMLSQIEEDRKIDASAIIQFVSLASRPLSLEELTYFTQQQPEAGFSATEIAAEKIDFCEGLVCWRGSRLILVHNSLREYLVRVTRESLHGFEILQSRVHTSFALLCMNEIERSMQAEEIRNAFEILAGKDPSISDAATFLHGGLDAAKRNWTLKDSLIIMPDHFPQAFASFQDAYPLADYAVRFWVSHAARAENDLLDLQRSFFAPNDTIRVHAVFYLQAAGKPVNAILLGGTFIRKPETMMPLLNFAIRCGFRQLLAKTLRSGNDDREQDSSAYRALHQAIKSDFLSDQQDPTWDSCSAVDELLRYLPNPLGDQILLRNVYGESPSFSALASHRPVLVQRLVARMSGAWLKSNDVFYHNPLHFVLKTMSSEGANEDDWMTTLKTIVRRMPPDVLNKQVDAHHMTPLYFCVRYGSTNMTRVLLQGGADPDAIVRVPITLDFISREPVYEDDLERISFSTVNMAREHSLRDDQHRFINMTALEDARLRHDHEILRLCLLTGTVGLAARFLPVFQTYEEDNPLDFVAREALATADRVRMSIECFPGASHADGSISIEIENGFAKNPCTHVS